MMESWAVLLWNVTPKIETMIKTKWILVWTRTALRLNNPRHRWGTFLWKLDRWLFAYGDTNGIPCFLGMHLPKRQLVVNGKPVYRGGGVNCYNEPQPILPTIVNKETFAQCERAYHTKVFKVKNFEYNGFTGQLKEGHTDYVVNSMESTSDPGIYNCACSDGNIRSIPSFAIEGIEIVYNPKQSTEVPLLFGQPCAS